MKLLLKDFDLYTFAKCLGIALLIISAWIFLCSCTVTRQITSTGFDQSRVFTVGGYLYSVDHSFVAQLSPQGVETWYDIDDPKVSGIVERYRNIRLQELEAQKVVRR